MPADDTPEDYQFLPRLLGTYLLAFVAYYAVDKSLFMEVMSVAGWAALTIHLLRRFGRRGLWALAAAPLAFYWAWILWSAAAAPTTSPPAGAIIV